MNAAASSGEEKKLDGIKERERGEGGGKEKFCNFFSSSSSLAMGGLAKGR